MPRKPLVPASTVVPDDTDYEPPTSDPREPFPVPTAPAGEHDGEQGEHPARNGDAPEPQPKAAPMAPGEAEKVVSRLRRGWGAANQQIDRNSDYAQAFKPEENVTYVIKFMEDDPYVTFNRHWVERPSQKGGKVNIPYTCLRSDGIDKPCPLCDIAGDPPKSVTSFNIAVVEKDGTVTLKSFDVTAKLFRTIQNFARDTLYSPLPKRWWAVKKSKDSRGYYETTLTPVMSDASLHDDYGYKVPTEAALAELDLYEPDIVQVRPVSELMELAKEMQAQEEFNPYGDS